jgi:XTP/dITP diphosphohydrolase
MELYFATQNPNKVAEVMQLAAREVVVKDLSSLPISEEIPETGKTIAENSLQKARYVFDKYQVQVFADDTGLEVDALNGEPGVYSARYAGPDKDSEANMQLVLEKLEGQKDRSARFVTVISYIDQEGKVYQFEGEVQGQITMAKKGERGFGYDPIFLPDGYEHTFAEMPLEQKNKISHRALALKKFMAFINEHL